MQCITGYQYIILVRHFGDWLEANLVASQIIDWLSAHASNLGCNHCRICSYVRKSVNFYHDCLQAWMTLAKFWLKKLEKLALM